MITNSGSRSLGRWLLAGTISYISQSCIYISIYRRRYSPASYISQSCKGPKRKAMGASICKSRVEVTDQTSGVRNITCSNKMSIKKDYIVHFYQRWKWIPQKSEWVRMRLACLRVFWLFSRTELGYQNNRIRMWHSNYF